ncbi:MAG: hypothetical protein ACYS0D_14250 [Planctomycetota bacterium]|jgi:hypothetical protein
MKRTSVLCLSILIALLGAGVSLATVDVEGNTYVAGDPPAGRDPVDPPPVPLGTQVFDNQADFFAAAGSLTIEDFEDEPLVGDPSSGGVAMLTFDDFTATCDPPALKLLDVESVGNHNTTPGGIKYLGVDTDIGGVNGDVTHTFDFPLTALGMFMIDIEGSLELTINGVVYPIPSTTSGGEAYFGIVSSTPFTTVDITSPGNDSFYSMDDVAYGSDGGGDGGGEVPATSRTGVVALVLVLAVSSAYMLRRRTT